MDSLYFFLKSVLNCGQGTVQVQKMNVFPLIVLYPEASGLPGISGGCPAISAEISKPCLVTLIWGERRPSNRKRHDSSGCMFSGIGLASSTRTGKVALGGAPGCHSAREDVKFHSGTVMMKITTTC